MRRPYFQIGSTAPVTPTSFSNCVLWLDSTDNSTITQVANLVSQWNDKSGHSNNVVQSNPTNKFTVTAAQINSKQVMATPFISGFTANTGMATTLVGGSLSAFSFGMLVQPLATTQTYSALIATENATGDLTIETNGSDATKLDVYVNAVGASGATATGTFNTGTTYFVFATYSTPNLNIWVNNIQVLTNNTTNLTGRQLNAILSIGGNTGAGGYHPLHGYVGDVVLYGSVLSSANMNSLYKNFIKPKWGTP